jgi:predicted GNAT family N-acyltransferase
MSRQRLSSASQLVLIAMALLTLRTAVWVRLQACPWMSGAAAFDWMVMETAWSMLAIGVPKRQIVAVMLTDLAVT